MNQTQITRLTSFTYGSRWMVMRCAVFIFALNVFTGYQAQAQDSYYYGVSQGGGAANKGYIFRFSENLDNYEVVHDFLGTALGSFPDGSVLQASDGWLYGTTRYGGTVDQGILYRFEPVNGAFEVLHDFATLNDGGLEPFGDLIELADGKIYGTTNGGGLDNPLAGPGGVIFSYDLQNQTYEMRHSFTSPNGEFEGVRPQFGLTLGPDGKLYGITTAGGANSFGTLFAFDAENDSFNTLHHFQDGVDGRSPKCRLMLASNGNFYGTTVNGGPVNNSGTLFQFNPTNNNFIVVHNFTATGPEGRSPLIYQLLEAQPNVFYGTTYYGGAHGDGTLYRYNHVSSSVDTLMSFGGNAPKLGQSLMELPDGRLFGYCTYTDEGYLGSVMYTYDFSMQDEGEEPLGFPFTSEVLTEQLSLVKTRPTLVNLSSLSVSEVKGSKAWILYPNPATQRVYLPNAGHVEVYNTLGVRMYSGLIDTEGLDIAQWANGIYFVRQMEVSSAPHRTGRFVKQ